MQAIATAARSRHHDHCSIEEIVEEAKNGRMFILVDDVNCENKAFLIMPAQMATPEKIDFMSQHGRGLICLALSQERIAELELAPMGPRNGTHCAADAMISIEAREGATTEISTADRARTISIAIDRSKGQADLLTPGHVFPLAAKAGGVLVRVGHTEAAVDISRLAGLNPSGVICEIMNADGAMARMDDITIFAQRHAFKVGAISDLIRYRRRFDHIVERLQSTRFISRWGGEWDLVLFRNKVTGGEHVVLVKGEINVTQPVLVRMHTLSLFDDILGAIGEREGLVSHAMEIIGERGQGLIVLISRGGPGELIHQTVARDLTNHPREMDELYDYGVVAQILSDLGIEDMILLRSSHSTPVPLTEYGINIVEQWFIHPKRAYILAI